MAFTSQVTAVFDVPVTEAVNCFVCPVATEAEAGEMETEIPAEAPLIVTGAMATLLESAELTAAMFTVAGDGAVAGAVYRPEPEIVPTVELPPVTAFTSQVTAVFDEPVTDAVNCCVWPVWIEADAGEIETETVAEPAVKLISATALLVESALLVAPMFTDAGNVTAGGAVYNPELEIVPITALPPGTPFTVHVTAVFVVPVSDAVNCFVCPAWIEAVAGEIEIVIVPDESLRLIILLGSIWPAAATVTLGDQCGSLLIGAVYNSRLETVTAFKLPPLIPLKAGSFTALEVPLCTAIGKKVHTSSGSANNRTVRITSKSLESDPAVLSAGE